MIWLRLIVVAFAFLFAVYYFMLILQLMTNGAFRITNRKFTFSRCVIPFYYWIASQNEPHKKTNRK